MTIVTYGTMLENTLQAAEKLAEQKIEASVVRLMSASHFDAEQILSHAYPDAPILVVEEVCAGSGIKEALTWQIRNRIPTCRVDGIDLGRDFVTHGSQQKLYQECGLDAESIAKFAKEMLS